MGTTAFTPFETPPQGNLCKFADKRQATRISCGYAGLAGPRAGPPHERPRYQLRQLEVAYAARGGEPQPCQQHPRDDPHLWPSLIKPMDYKALSSQRLWRWLLFQQGIQRYRYFSFVLPGIRCAAPGHRPPGRAAIYSGGPSWVINKKLNNES